ncbi:3'-5' exoribonuclease domain-containing protein [Klebsiella aerogenes]
MNNYAYLIKAKAKATEAKNLFCWFSAKSDSRAERRILDILEDAEINVGRGANHQLPIRTNWLIVDDLPEEGVLDDTWCDRYELVEDGLTWQKIVAPAAAEPQADNEPENNTSTDSEEDYSANEDALFNLAEMSFRTQLLAQYMADDRHVYHISIPHRDRLSLMEMDTENHAVQNLILAAENVPEIKKYDMPGLWKFTSAFKTVFPEGKRYELGKQVQFAKLWFETAHIDRGFLTKEWAAGNSISAVNRTPSGANAGGGNVTDRKTPLTRTGLAYEIAAGLLARVNEFDIYNPPFKTECAINAIMNDCDNLEFTATVKLFEEMPGGMDYSRACNIATVKTTPEGLWKDPVKHREYLNRVMTEADHAHPDELIVDIACGRSSMPMPMRKVEEPDNSNADKMTDANDQADDTPARELEIRPQVELAISGKTAVMDLSEASELLNLLEIERDNFIKSLSFDLYFMEVGGLSISDDEIHHLTLQALHKWIKVPARRVRMLEEALANIRTANSMSENPERDDLQDKTNQILAANRGEYIEGISDPNDGKWVTEDLTKTNSNAEATSDVQMEENFGNETEVNNEISESETAVEKGTGNADIGSETTTVNIESGHHNDVEELPADNVHVMVDLETMGNKQDAPIVAIGAVVFDPATGSIGESFYKVVSLESSVNWGAKIDPSTVIWWLKQSSEARSAIVNDDAIPLLDALLQFREFIFENIPGGRKKAQVWGNGASFDNCILRSSFDYIAEEYPWEYWNDRDVRTIVEIGKAIGIDPKKTIPFEGERHNALADAIHQARYVSAIWQRLIEGNQVWKKLTAPVHVAI